MSDHRSPPPDPAACLGRRRASSQKGGTLIAEDVSNLETHRQRLCDPDGYRPNECPSCRHEGLHAHDLRGRVLSADPQAGVVMVRIYLCVGCGGTWRVLPGFVARHLWRSWRTVETGTGAGPPPPSQPRIPERTVRRWRERAASAARMLVQVFATSGSVLLEAIAKAVGLDATRSELVAAYVAAVSPAPTSPFATVAGLVHRLEPGVRLV